jgi:hypothetical protein
MMACPGGFEHTNGMLAELIELQAMLTDAAGCPVTVTRHGAGHFDFEASSPPYIAVLKLTEPDTRHAAEKAMLWAQEVRRELEKLGTAT